MIHWFSLNNNKTILAMSQLSINIKSELLHLVEKESDETLLQVIKHILVQPARSALVKAKLTIRALQSEEDMQQGRVYTLEKK